jgi:hypothetical protein
MTPKYVLVPHSTNSFIFNVQPSLPTTTVSVWMEHVESIVPAASGFAVVI